MKELTAASKKNYIEAQEAFIKMTGLTTGSKVQIVRKSKTHEYGWPNSWVDEYDMSATYTVDRISHNGIYFKENSYGFPFFVLNVLSNPVDLPDPIWLKKGSAYQVEFLEGGNITVGCQKDIPYEVLAKIYDTATKVKYAADSKI